MNWSLWTLLASHHEHFTSLLRARVYSNLLKGKCVKNIKKKKIQKKSPKKIFMLLLLKSILLVKYLAICVLLRVRLGICAVTSDFESYVRVLRGQVSPKPYLSLLFGSVSLNTTHMITWKVRTFKHTMICIILW